MRFNAFAIILLPWVLFHLYHASDAYEGPWYDSSAYTECKANPEAPLYDGGILKNTSVENEIKHLSTEYAVYSPAFVLDNLHESIRYTFSCWVKIRGTDSSLVKARLSTDNTTLKCIGSVVAKSHCWSFLKGGFILGTSSETSVLHFHSTDADVFEISVASASLQPFSVEQWQAHQEDNINTRRKRTVTIHVSDSKGDRLSGASVSVHQLSKDFPFGSAIAKTILGNSAYQEWFAKRFNAAVFENELKWYVTESKPGQLNYTLADQMLEFTRANQIVVRGHNIFWEDPTYTPAWVRNLTGDDLRSAVSSRIQSLLSRYKGDFVHWDVNNEMLHFDFYEQQLGPDASLRFFHIAQQSDPLATLFMNDFNVVETCNDSNSTVDSYIDRLQELKKSGAALLQGIGLEGHFGKPNLPLMRAVLDKLATLQLPIWLTEVDISKTYDHQTQALFLEEGPVWPEVLREGFSHASVNGIMLWTALHSNGCYQMCLTDDEFNNLPTGDAVDRLLKEWETGETEGDTDDHGSYSFSGFLGNYKVSAQYENRTSDAILSLSRGDETKHLNIHI